MPEEVIPQNQYIGYTLAFSPKMKLNNRFIPPTIIRKFNSIGFKACTATYGLLSPDDQCNYMRSVLDRTALHPDIDLFCGRFELTKAGVVHFHGMIKLHENPYDSVYNLNTIRSFIMMDKTLITHCKANKGKFMNMCYVTGLKDVEEWYKYIDKDKDKLPFEEYIRRNPFDYESEEKDDDKNYYIQP